jgi:hypothetical protein
MASACPWYSASEMQFVLVLSVQSSPGAYKLHLKISHWQARVEGVCAGAVGVREGQQKEHSMRTLPELGKGAPLNTNTHPPHGWSPSQVVTSQHSRCQGGGRNHRKHVWHFFKMSYILLFKRILFLFVFVCFVLCFVAQGYSHCGHVTGNSHHEPLLLSPAAAVCLAAHPAGV